MRITNTTRIFLIALGILCLAGTIYVVYPLLGFTGNVVHSTVGKPAYVEKNSYGDRLIIRIQESKREYLLYCSKETGSRLFQVLDSKDSLRLEYYPYFPNRGLVLSLTGENLEVSRYDVSKRQTQERRSAIGVLLLLCILEVVWIAWSRAIVRKST